MPLDNTQFEEASENTRLMDAHVATSTSSGGDVNEGQSRKRKPRTSSSRDNRENPSHVNYGSV